MWCGGPSVSVLGPVSCVRPVFLLALRLCVLALCVCVALANKFNRKTKKREKYLNNVKKAHLKKKKEKI